MSNIVSITTGAHPQNGVQVRMINILDQQYVFADKRRRSRHTTIDIEFAKRIIAAVPAKHYYADRMPSSTDMRLSWDYLTGGTIELRLHGNAGHIYTSLPQ
jgi:hypothetical protein